MSWRVALSHSVTLVITGEVSSKWLASKLGVSRASIREVRRIRPGARRHSVATLSDERASLETHVREIVRRLPVDAASEMRDAGCELLVSATTLVEGPRGTQRLARRVVKSLALRQLGLSILHMHWVHMLDSASTERSRVVSCHRDDDAPMVSASRTTTRAGGAAHAGLLRAVSAGGTGAHDDAHVAVARAPRFTAEAAGFRWLRDCLGCRMHSSGCADNARRVVL